MLTISKSIKKGNRVIHLYNLKRKIILFLFYYFEVKYIIQTQLFILMN